MAREVVWTQTAWRDLERTADYIAEDSPGYAAAFVERIRDRARSLDELAFRGRIVPELGEATVCELLIGRGRWRRWKSWASLATVRVFPNINCPLKRDNFTPEPLLKGDAECCPVLFAASRAQFS